MTTTKTTEKMQWGLYKVNADLASLLRQLEEIYENEEGIEESELENLIADKSAQLERLCEQEDYYLEELLQIAYTEKKAVEGYKDLMREMRKRQSNLDKRAVKAKTIAQGIITSKGERKVKFDTIQAFTRQSQSVNCEAMESYTGSYLMAILSNLELIKTAIDNHTGDNEAVKTFVSSELDKLIAVQPYIKSIDIAGDKTEIKKAVKAGEHIPGVEIVENESLTIKV